jgi:hypothetical protein
VAERGSRTESTKERTSQVVMKKVLFCFAAERKADRLNFDLGDLFF